jgi:hypothetical protein
MTEFTALQKFARELLTASFEGSSFDGDDIQQLALKHDLVRVEIYDPEVHVTMQSCEALDKGDEIYLFNDVIEPQSVADLEKQKSDEEAPLFRSSRINLNAIVKAASNADVKEGAIFIEV